MFKYFSRRIILTLIQLWLVTTVVFFMVHMLPGDPAYIILGASDAYVPTQEQLDMVRQELGLDRPLIVQYTSYLSKVAQGDFGTSFTTSRPVSLDLSLRFMRTLRLVLPSVIISAIIGVSSGLISAIFRGKKTDISISTVALLAHSIPAFVLANFFVLFFSIKMGWLPSSGYKEFSAGIAIAVSFMVMPVLTLSTRSAASSMRMTRMAVVEQMTMDYVRTARAKGIRESVVILKHVMRNALLPVVTVIGLQMGAMFGSAIVVEACFNWPGLSTLLQNAVNSRDYPVIQGCMLVLSTIFIIVNLITDLSYALLDPRVTVGD